MMKGFTANLESSPTSTPNEPQRRHNLFSTATPDLPSTTPLAPPPSHPFGSSQFGSGVSKLQLGRRSDDPAFKFKNTPKPIQSQQPQSRPLNFSARSEQDLEDDVEEYTQDIEEERWDEDQSQSFNHFNFRGSEKQSQNFSRTGEPSLMRFSTASTKRSPANLPRNWSRIPSQHTQLPRKGNEEFVPGLARDLAKRTSLANLENDSDDVIVGTEQLLRQLDEENQDTRDNDSFQLLISENVQELEALWEDMSTTRKATYDGLEIGPGPTASKFENARFIAVLILRLHNPRMDQELNTMPIPARLLEWLNTFHASYDIAFSQVVNTSPNPTANELFWEVIENLTARGRFEDVMRLLADANFAYALVGTERGLEEAHYSGAEQQAIQSAVFRARQVMNACPAVQTRDWNMENQEWDLFRKEVEAALDDLTELATEFLEADNNPRQPHLQTLSSFGSSRKQGKGLPFEIYGHLKTIYSILLGASAEIISISNDWLEASMLLTVWWNGASDQKVSKWSFDVSRSSYKQGIDEVEGGHYLNRLKNSFLAVTDPSSDESFQLNPLSPIHLSIGAILQGDLQSALAILQTLSLCLTSAVTEVGTWSGWLRAVAPPAGLNQEDLMVLTNGNNDLLVSRDEVLERYSCALFAKKQFTTSDGVFIEGWELAFSVASRIENQNVVRTTISSFLTELPVTQKDRAERLVTLCDELGLAEESRKVSESFGDYLVNNTTNYGMALLCYARGHAEPKIRQLIDVLNSYCLVQSKAYPPHNELDPSLEHLVSNPKAALSGVVEIDPAAAEALQFYLVGYACLRRFYCLRDDETTMNSSSQHLGAPERKRLSARALLAAINSAADSIYGGLYDPERKSAIQVDGLLALLGEATIFITQSGEKRILTSEQMYALLAAIEDLQTVSDRVYAAAEECLEAALRNYHGSLPPSPHAMLKKSMSSATNSNFSFSMMGSEMLSRSEDSLGAKSLGSAVLVSKSSKAVEVVTRGWDWRSGFKEQGTTGVDILRYLRMGIAKDLSIADLEEGILS